MNINRSSFFKNTLALYSLNIVRLLFPLLTLPYLTRVLSLDIYGMVTYSKALITYVQLVIDFGFMLSATKKIVNAGDNRERIGMIVGDTLIEKMILVSLTIPVYLLIIYQVPLMTENLFFSILYLVSAVLNVFLFDFLFRGLEQMYGAAVPYVVAKTITTLLTFVLVKGNSSILWIPILEILGNTVAVLVSYYLMLRLQIRLHFSNWKIWKQDLKDSFTYFLSNFATTIFGAFTTVIAGFYLQSRDIAFWGLAMQLLSATKALYNPIANSLYPHMIRTKEIRFIHKINALMSIPIALGILITLLFSEKILLLIGGDQYTSSGVILKGLLPAFVASFYSMLYGWPVLGAIDKQKETTATTIVAAIVQILVIVLAILTNHFTLFMLAISCSLAECVLFFSRYFLYLKYKSFFV